MKTMATRLFHFLVLVILIAAALPAAAQEPTATLPPYPKTELFAGYSFWAPNGSVQGHDFTNITPGFFYGGTYFFDKKVHRRFGLDVEGSYHRSSPCTNCVYTISAGPAAQYAKANFLFNIHALFGAASMSGPNIPVIVTSTGNTFYANPSHWGTVLSFGGSIDHPIPHAGKHLSWRIAQLDVQYIHDNFGPVQPTTGGTANVTALQVSTGIVYRWHNLK